MPPGGHCWDCYLGTRSSLSSHCNSYEDRVSVEFADSYLQMCCCDFTEGQAVTFMAMNVDMIGVQGLFSLSANTPDSKVPGANIRPIWGRQDPGGSHVGPRNLAIWDVLSPSLLWSRSREIGYVILIGSIWKASRQLCCGGAWQISERLEKYKPQSRGSGDIAVNSRI